MRGAELAVPAGRGLALDPSPFGVNSHQADPALLARLASIGIVWQRFDVYWNEIEPAPGTFEWSALDRFVDGARRLGLALYGCVSRTPAWAAGAPDPALPPQEPARFVGFVRQLARRYRGQVQAWGVWNEPNLAQFFKGTRESYVRDLLVPALEVLRDEVPEVVRAGPDLSSSGGPRRFGPWLDAVLEAAGGLLEVVTHHQYDGGDSVSGRVRALEALHARLVARGLGDRPLWVTEIGWEAVRGTTLAGQAENLKAVMRAMDQRAEWWRKTFWYDSHGPGWGLLAPDGATDRGQPRPAFAAYRDAIAEGRRRRVWVERAYLGILGRPADLGGESQHVAALARGTPPLAMTRALFASPEFARSRGGLPAERLALDLYRNLLGRERDPDAGELSQTADALRGGKGPERAADMLESAEFAQRFLPASTAAPAAPARPAAVASAVARPAVPPAARGRSQVKAATRPRPRSAPAARAPRQSKPTRGRAR